MMAKLMPEEQIIEDMEKDMKAYKEASNPFEKEQARKKIVVDCILFSTKMKMDTEGLSINDSLEQISEVKQALRMVDGDKIIKKAGNGGVIPTKIINIPLQVAA